MTFFADLPLPVQFFLAFVIIFELTVATVWAAATAARLGGALRGQAVGPRSGRLRERRSGADAPRRSPGDDRQTNQHHGRIHRRAVPRACGRRRKQAATRRNETGDGEAGEDVFSRIVAQAERDGFTELARMLETFATRVGGPRPRPPATLARAPKPPGIDHSSAACSALSREMVE
jgi:hypothetical protein